MEEQAHTHAEQSARDYFDKFKDDDDMLARRPDRNDGFNDFMRSTGRTWADFEQADAEVAQYIYHRYEWFEGYEYRRLLVRRFRETLN